MELLVILFLIKLYARRNIFPDDAVWKYSEILLCYQ